jgi:beta-glucosidase
VVAHLGTDVKFWLTINEPTVYMLQGYILGEWPPCLRSSWLKAALVVRNLARAHIAAYHVLHHRRQNTMVGFAHSAPLVLPCDPARQRDRMAAAWRDWILNRTFFRCIGTGRTLDFIGINYYTRTIVRSVGWGIGALVGRACRLPHHRDRGPRSTTGWEVYPAGLALVLERFAAFGLPVLITENGVATDDETLRRDALLQHLHSLARAVEKGVHVLGYLYWSLMDNFEWTLGVQARFGLAAVDFTTQQRLPRPCAEDFARVCRTSRLLAGA